MDIKNTSKSLGTVHTEFGILVIFSSCGGLWRLLLLCSSSWEAQGLNNARGSASVVISTLGAGSGTVSSCELQGVPLKDWDNCDPLSMWSQNTTGMTLKLSSTNHSAFGTDQHHQDGNAPPGFWARVTQREKTGLEGEHSRAPHQQLPLSLSLSFFKSAWRIKCSQQSQ